jgi:hypothetical protein
MKISYKQSSIYAAITQNLTEFTVFSYNILPMCAMSQQRVFHISSQSSDIKPTFHFSSYCVLTYFKITCFFIFSKLCFFIFSKLSVNFHVKMAAKWLTRDKQEKDRG